MELDVIEAAELAALEQEFEAAGGRGVELADRIDALRHKRDARSFTVLVSGSDAEAADIADTLGEVAQELIDEHDAMRVTVELVPEPQPVHQPSGLAAIRAKRMPPELLALSGVTYILDALADRWDDGDPWGSAMASGFAICEAMYSLGLGNDGFEIPATLNYSPGAWDGTFTADDIWTHGGGDHELTVEILSCIADDRAEADQQLTSVALALGAIIDRVKVEGKDY